MFWILITVLVGMTAGSCPDLARNPCHCAAGVPCHPQTHRCPGDCAPGWSGDFCERGGNIALGRNVTTSDSPLQQQRSLANDGDTSVTEGRCAKIGGRPSWWRVGLDGLYRIGRVILHVPVSERGQTLEVMVARSGDSLGVTDVVRCVMFGHGKSGLYPDSRGVVSLQCPITAVGTSFILKRSESPLNICEVTIHGQVFVEDEPTPANTVTGYDDPCLDNCTTVSLLSLGETYQRSDFASIPSAIFLTTTCVLTLAVVFLVIYTRTWQRCLFHKYSSTAQKTTQYQSSIPEEGTAKRYVPNTCGPPDASTHVLDGQVPEACYDDPEEFGETEGHLQGDEPSAQYDVVAEGAQRPGYTGLSW